MGGTRQIVRTTKGAFILTANGDRTEWDVSGPIAAAGRSTT